MVAWQARSTLGVLQGRMFKKTKHPDFIVGHRLGGNHAKRDPLDDEKVGGNKRSRVEDGSSSVVYKETAEERKARLKAEKEAEKELRRAEKEGRQANLATPSSGASDDKAASSKTAKTMGALAKLKEAQGKLSSFKDRLKASSLPADAAAAETKHKEERAKEEAEALAKISSSAADESKASTPDSDERLSMNDIWKAGEADEEEGGNWLDGKGLKFHTTADKAFSMAKGRFKEAVECHDPLENREAAADLAKKRSELRMAEMRRKQS
eukprot:TRINITY_DN618_c1_g1_i2.p1 TRINITY_DN618_c1_g1~~TRINITY_DN618_c1_g1_i2.p1  ORF type:complete len:267 (+),score=94.72 TRINITY_DN618_c1_g1_i2:38-838(+)